MTLAAWCRVSSYKEIYNPCLWIHNCRYICRKPMAIQVQTSVNSVFMILITWAGKSSHWDFLFVLFGFCFQFDFDSLSSLSWYKICMHWAYTYAGEKGAFQTWTELSMLYCLALGGQLSWAHISSLLLYV